MASDYLLAIRIPRPAHLAALAASQEAEQLTHEVAASYRVVLPNPT